MVSFSLRLRISYLLLQDSSLVSFHLIQFGFNKRRVCALACCLAMGQNCAPGRHVFASPALVRGPKC